MMPELNRRFFESLMEEKNLSLRGLAAKMEMNHSQLSLTFSGGRKMQLDEASKLSHIFGVPLHKIVENAGVTVKPLSGKRVPVIGAVQGNGTVELYEGKIVERTTAPDGLPPDTTAIQCRTSGTVLDWMDGWVMFCREHNGMDHAFLGRVCLTQLKDGPAVLSMIRRGYRENTYNLSGPYKQDSAEVGWVTPILLTRN